MSGSFVFFKQKTAYELRIRDWSSDVCSSDLVCLMGTRSETSACESSRMDAIPNPARRWRSTGATRAQCAGVGTRSEEHTSELQSLMRISYAVFCLKKKTKFQEMITHTKTQQIVIVNSSHTSHT